MAYSNENFREARNELFYADKTNAFKMNARETADYTVVYICTPAIVITALLRDRRAGADRTYLHLLKSKV